MFAFFWVNQIVLAADPGAGGALTQFLLLFAPLFLIWYFLVILPQKRQKRKVQDMLANLKTGDRVITSGGLYGNVIGFRGDSVVQMEIANQVKVNVARSAITGIQSPQGAEDGSSKEPVAKSAPKEKSLPGEKEKVLKRR